MLSIYTLSRICIYNSYYNRRGGIGRDLAQVLYRCIYNYRASRITNKRIYNWNGLCDSPASEAVACGRILRVWRNCHGILMRATVHFSNEKNQSNGGPRRAVQAGSEGHLARGRAGQQILTLGLGGGRAVRVGQGCQAVKAEIASCRNASRRKKAGEFFQNAVASLGTISHGYSLFGVTRGQCSMIDLILACLDQCGPSKLSLWTWCIAEYEVQCFERLMKDKRITSALLVIDSRAKTRSGGDDLLHRWIDFHGPESIRWVTNHAKLATIESKDFKLLLRGSMNLNFNPRFEQFDIDEGHPGFDLVRKIELELPVLRFEHSKAESHEASGLGLAWTQDQLVPFQTLKTWAK